MVSALTPTAFARAPERNDLPPGCFIQIQYQPWNAFQSQGISFSRGQISAAFAVCPLSQYFVRFPNILLFRNVRRFGSAFQNSYQVESPTFCDLLCDAAHWTDCGCTVHRCSADPDPSGCPRACPGQQRAVPGRAD